MANLTFYVRILLLWGINIVIIFIVNDVVFRVFHVLDPVE